jgi:glucokinase
MKRPAVIGIDLGGTNCRGALVCDNGEVFFQEEFATDIDAGLPRFWARFISFCRKLMEQGAAQGFSIHGLGLGFPGLVSKEGDILKAPNLAPFNGMPLCGRLRTEIGVPVRVVNDVNAVALGECYHGAGRDFSDFLMVTLGTGVGGSLIIGRKIWNGIDGAAGEVGHIAVKPGGHLCGCGSRGCLEQYASGPALVRICRQFWFRCKTEGGAEGLPQTAKEVADAALRGQPAALKAYEVAGKYLGQVFAGIANLLNLEGVVVGGGVSANYKLFMPSLRAELDCRAFSVSAERMKVVPAALGNRAGILGAAQLAREMLDRTGAL